MILIKIIFPHCKLQLFSKQAQETSHIQCKGGKSKTPLTSVYIGYYFSCLKQEEDNNRLINQLNHSRPVACQSACRKPREPTGALKQSRPYLCEWNI